MVSFFGLFGNSSGEEETTDVSPSVPEAITPLERVIVIDQVIEIFSKIRNEQNMKGKRDVALLEKFDDTIKKLKDEQLSVILKEFFHDKE